MTGDGFTEKKKILTQNINFKLMKFNSDQNLINKIKQNKVIIYLFYDVKYSIITFIRF